MKKNYSRAKFKFKNQRLMVMAFLRVKIFGKGKKSKSVTSLFPEAVIGGLKISILTSKANTAYLLVLVLFIIIQKIRMRIILLMSKDGLQRLKPPEKFAKAKKFLFPMAMIGLVVAD